MQIDNGNSGTFSLSFGAEYKARFEIQVVTDKGAVTVSPHEVVILANNGSKEKKEQRINIKSDKSINAEITAFAQSIKCGKVDDRLTPEQALLDIRLLQAMLESGKEAGAVKSVRPGH